MFELLFKYPSAVFEKGTFVFLASWPAWVLIAAILAVAAALAWHVLRNRGRLEGRRPVALWLLESGMASLILLLLWQPALSVATLRPQQNVIALLVDDSRSMAAREGDSTRLEQARALLDGGLQAALEQKFQVRLYRFGQGIARIRSTSELSGAAGASRVGDSLREVVAESATLPLGAVVVLSDGADNSGGIDLETISEIRRQRVPVHTVGFGRHQPARDLEIRDVALPARALADSRLSARVSFRQHGFARGKARLVARDGDKVVASQEVTLAPDGVAQIASLVIPAGAAPGARSFRVAVEPLEGEENRENNTLTRLVNVGQARRRILYIEGEPRWEFKFIRRAIEDDRSLELVSMLRTTPNKIYRQKVSSPKELEDGFPAKAEELFGYQGLIIGNVEAGYFNAAQQELIREFANRRGGGILFLAGRAALSDGAWARSALAELLPVALADTAGTFHRDPATAELTALGRESVICRLEERGDKNAGRWKKMPQLADYQRVGDAKPGAVVLMQVNAGSGRPAPLLVTQNYGRGRTALFATGGSWHWQMLQPHTDLSHEIFWRQLLRYLAGDTPGQVVASTPRPVLNDDGRARLRVDARDKAYCPVSNARVEARIAGPEGASDTIELSPQPLEEGVYTGEWAVAKPGSYLAEIIVRRGEEEIGRDVVTFAREDGVAENFGLAQNRELLEKLAGETGGRYYTAADAKQLASEISYSEAGITTRETRELWNMPVVFLLAITLRTSEWLLRRRWGVV